MKSIKNIFNLNNFSLPLLLWFVFYSWRPWMLGFYYDDWGYLVAGAHQGAPLSFERLAWYLHVAIDRPMAGINHWFFTSLLGDNPVLWHALMALIFLMFMMVFHRFLKALFRMFSLPDNHPSIAIATAFWPCLPWLFGWAAWPCTTGYIYMTLFTLCGERLLAGWNADRPVSNLYWLAPALIFGVLCFYYEQFYGQFILFFVFAWLAGATRPLFSKKILLPLSALMAVQVAALAWNRLHSHRGVQQAFVGILSSSLSELPNRMLKSAGSMKGLVIVATVLLVLLSGWALWRWWRQHPQTAGTGLSAESGSDSPHPGRFHAALPAAMLVAVAGMLMCIAFYAAGGYEIYTLGTTSRTANGLSFWLVTLLSLLLYFALSVHRECRIATVQAMVIALLMVSMGVANAQRTLEWSHAWRMSQHILDSLPADTLPQLAAPGTGILYDGPFRYKQVPFFGSPIGLASALRYRYPELARPKGPEDFDNPFSWAGLTPMLLCSRATIHWDGRQLAQTVSGMLHQAPVSALWLWDVQARTMTRLTPPTDFRCDYKGDNAYQF